MSKKNEKDTTPATTSEAPTPATPAIDPEVARYRAEVAIHEARKLEAKRARQAAAAGDGPRRLASGKLSARGLTCLCGCGQATTTRDARFLSGHDARMRAAILRANLAVSAIPEIARPFFEEGAIAGLLLADRGTEAERLVDVKNGGWA
jgi:hypothetical protein